MEDDYYSLLGVEPGAQTSDIRDAYRDKKAALDAKGDKNAVAQLNKAWNVLSDPYQRGRYDAEREQAEANGADNGEVEVVDDAPPPRRRLFEPRPRRDRNAPPPQPTIELPAGTRFPEPRRRVVAMVIDLTVLLLFFIGSQLIATSQVNSIHEEEVDAIEAIDDELDDLDQQRDDLEDADAPESQIEEVEDEIDAKQDERSELTDELTPTYRLWSAIFFGAALLYLVIPSAITGQTLGKKLQGVKVIRQDGRKLGWAGAVFRYGLLVAGAYVLSLLIPLLGVALVLFVVLGWMRNPNQQGMHDRTTKTLVVTEDSSDG